MTEPSTLHIRQADLQDAERQGLLPADGAAPLWHWLAQRAAPAPGPRFDTTHILYYLGGLLAIGAATLFLNEGFQRLGPWGLAGIGTLYLALCVMASGRLDGKGLPVPAGILATLAICLVPLVTWAVQNGLGLWPEGGSSRYAAYHTRIDWRWLTLELVTLAAAAVALWRLRHPFLMMPVAFTLWYLGMDLARLIVDPSQSESWAFHRDFTMVFGLLIALLGLWVDARSRGRGGSGRDYAFWPYLLGVLSFWCALTARRSDSEFDKFLYLLLNLGLIGVSAVLGRRVFAVCGGLGVALYLGHLSHKVFRDSLLFPLALTLIGLGVMACGVVWQRHESAIQAALRRRLPGALQRWLPQG
ncbi:MAG: DUF2157 domain-containing protein [Rubrivivax sp.]|nr:DUF2157 domain-containing protein [Rubrivivax sp.]